MIWKLLLIYFLIAIFNFLKNTYRMIHTKFLRNTYTKNINKGCPQKNYELLIAISKVLSKADVYEIDLESELQSIYGISRCLDKSFVKAYYHYKYLMKHCFTWICRIPLPRFRFVRNKKLNVFLQFLVFSVSTVAVYFFGLYLDNSGLGLKVLNCLTDFLNNLF